MKRNISKKFVIPVVACIAIIFFLCYYFFFTPLLNKDGNYYLYIDSDDTIDSVYAKLDTISTSYAMTGFKTLVRHSSYDEHIRTGRYEIKKGNSAFTVFRKLKSGLQSSVNLTIPNIRTIDKLAGVLAKKLMADSLSIYEALTDSAICAKYGYTKATILCMFIPNTYEIYWNTPIDRFLDKMNNESKKFWNFERTKKAEAMNLTKEEVITMASIVDEETANDNEKPMVAGMYYNRLKAGMPLQADPTVKYAIGDFSIRRITHAMLKTVSPYNTYQNIGLPPGPIRIVTKRTVDAVLNAPQHDYLYMCAREDFSGYHNFTASYTRHLANARRYQMELNRRGIK